MQWSFTLARCASAIALRKVWLRCPALWKYPPPPRGVSSLLLFSLALFELPNALMDPIENAHISSCAGPTHQKLFTPLASEYVSKIYRNPDPQALSSGFQVRQIGVRNRDVFACHRDPFFLWQNHDRAGLNFDCGLERISIGRLKRGDVGPDTHAQYNRRRSTIVEDFNERISARMFEILILIGRRVFTWPSRVEEGYSAYKEVCAFNVDSRSHGFLCRPSGPDAEPKRSENKSSTERAKPYLNAGKVVRPLRSHSLTGLWIVLGTGSAAIGGWGFILAMWPSNGRRLRLVGVLIILACWAGTAMLWGIAVNGMAM